MGERDADELQPTSPAADLPAFPSAFQPSPGGVPHPAVRRLSLYLRQLEAFARAGRKTVSSRDLGRALDLGDAQVRKDLATFGTFGQPGVGYDVTALVGKLRSIFGTDRDWPVVLVGAGNIGRALSAYKRFAEKGFHLAAAVDSSDAVAGQKIGNLKVRPARDLPAIVAETGARLAILAVPAENAQKVSESLVEAGVRGILNFAPVRLKLPERISVISVDLAGQLEQLAFQVNLTPG